MLVKTKLSEIRFGLKFYLNESDTRRYQKYMPSKKKGKCLCIIVGGDTKEYFEFSEKKIVWLDKYRSNIAIW